MSQAYPTTKSFWHAAPRPVMAMAPLANVTDAAFRQIIAKYGKPHVLYTEFVSADGLSSEQGRKRLMIDFNYTEVERPIVAQIFGATPKNFATAAKLVQELGFDGVDINTGCPDRAVNKQGAGAAMIQTPELLKEVVVAIREATPDLPLSIKTRLGFTQNQIDTWMNDLLDCAPEAIIIHARTRKEMSLVPPHWDQIAKAVQIRDARTGPERQTLVLGNGDVKSLTDAKEKCKTTGADGAMVGRAIFGNPWLFNPDIEKEDLTFTQILDVMVEHTNLFEKELGSHKNFALMRKFYGAYVSGFPGAKQLKTELMEAETASQVEKTAQSYIKSIGELSSRTLRQEGINGGWWKENHYSNLK